MTQTTNYLLRMQYDGTRYEGWQKQKGTELTIQGKLERVLEEFSGTAVEVCGSGRTDAGVHALAQAANVHLPGSPDAGEVKDYLNRYLPEDIRILSAEPVPERFHARFSAVRKTYCYQIDTGNKKDVFERKYWYGFPFSLDAEAMRKAAGRLIGTHDFKSFCGNKKMKKSTVRTLEQIEIVRQGVCGERLVLTYTGDGFLQYMVRILTGTLVEVGQGRRTPESMDAVLAALDRGAAGFTAPPEGLFLKCVEYSQTEGV